MKKMLLIMAAVCVLSACNKDVEVQKSDADATSVTTKAKIPWQLYVSISGYDWDALPGNGGTFPLFVFRPYRSTADGQGEYATSGTIQLSVTSDTTGGALSPHIDPSNVSYMGGSGCATLFMYPNYSTSRKSGTITVYYDDTWHTQTFTQEVGSIPAGSFSVAGYTEIGRNLFYAPYPETLYSFTINCPAGARWVISNGVYDRVFDTAGRPVTSGKSGTYLAKRGTGSLSTNINFQCVNLNVNIELYGY